MALGLLVKGSVGPRSLQLKRCTRSIKCFSQVLQSQSLQHVSCIMPSSSSPLDTLSLDLDWTFFNDSPVGLSAPFQLSEREQPSFYHQPYGFFKPSAEFAMFILSCFAVESFFVPCTAGCELGGQMTKRRCHTEPPIISRCGRLK